jgi:hypothetical protein
MNRSFACALLLAASFVAPVPAAAADVYTVLIDGRPLSDNPRDVGAVKSGGVVYVDAILMTKAFSGLLTFHTGGKEVVVTIEQRNATFTVGRPIAGLDLGMMHMSGAPFMYDGDMFVPASAFARFARSKLAIDPTSHVVSITTTHPPAR